MATSQSNWVGIKFFLQHTFPRIALTCCCIIVAWQLVVYITQVPHFILPSPAQVFVACFEHHNLLFQHGLITLFEIVAGLLLGTLLGISSALILISQPSAQRWALPLMVVSQSIPVFALAPLLTLWFGYGLASKIIMAILIIYFPVTAAAFDGLRHTPQIMVDLARTLNASDWSILYRIRLPAALPSIASGIRVATSIAPIGAIVGEWVGSSKGLGYLMLNANSRMQTDVMFAALLSLSLIAITLYSLVNKILNMSLHWQIDSSTSTTISTQ